MVPGFKLPLDAQTFKGALASLVLGAILWAGHEVLSLRDQDQTLQEHSKELTTLTTKQDATQTAIQDLKIVIERIDGKIDVLNQKIEDTKSIINFNRQHPTK